MSALKKIDETISRKFSKLCADHDSPFAFMRPFLRLLEVSGHGIPWLVGVIGVILFDQGRLFPRELLETLLIALVFDILVVSLIKAIVPRHRPQANDEGDMFMTFSVDYRSFPSGHTSRVVMLYLLLAPQVSYKMSLLIWTVMVSLSRVLLGRHYVGDICAGVTVGFLEASVFHNNWFQKQVLSHFYGWLEHVHIP